MGSPTFLLFGISQATLGFPGGAVVENPPANAGDTGLNADRVGEDPTGSGAAGPVSHNY